MNILLIILFSAMLIKILINLSRYIQCRLYLTSYLHYIKKPSWGFVEQTPQIIRLFINAGIEDAIVSSVEWIGFGYFQTSKPSVFNNISVTRNDIVNLALKMFHRSIGIYKSRLIETINPIYWIELIIFLPKKISNYLGVSPESIVIKIAQLLYWIIATIIGILLEVYKIDIQKIIQNWISTVF